MKLDRPEWAKNFEDEDDVEIDDLLVLPVVIDVAVAGGPGTNIDVDWALLPPPPGLKKYYFINKLTKLHTYPLIDICILLVLD